VELFALSVPSQAFCFGMTAYFHEPTGTDASTQVSPEIVPEQLAPIVWSAFVEASYRLTTYPATAVPLENVLCDQLTVTLVPDTLTVGVFPLGIDKALLFAAAFAELGDQMANASPATASRRHAAIGGTTRSLSRFTAASPTR
jgi:hypothetical protein